MPSSQQPLHNKAQNTSPNRKKSGKKQRAQPRHKRSSPTTSPNRR
ncbi:hypothetical protein AB6F11_09365 [Vibrio sp. 10N.247.311.14]|nr:MULTISPECIES: hypothetical protein [unclassified Vibrio]